MTVHFENAKYTNVKQDFKTRNAPCMCMYKLSLSLCCWCCYLKWYLLPPCANFTCHTYLWYLSKWKLLASLISRWFFFWIVCNFCVTLLVEIYLFFLLCGIIICGFYLFLTSWSFLKICMPDISSSLFKYLDTVSCLEVQ